MARQSCPAEGRNAMTTDVAKDEQQNSENCLLQDDELDAVSGGVVISIIGILVG
jgi:hypothetical protein